jgi:23S rRNA pseudouridine1911/1915/1917 synthase
MSQSFQFRITEEDAGKRLDEFLASRFGQLSRMRLANMVSAGACQINQSAAQRGWRIEAGDLVEIALDDASPTAMEPDDLPLEIAYEDDHLIVIVKPAGMLVHPTRNVKRGTLVNALAYHFNRDFYSALGAAPHGQRHSLTRPGLAHRLDRATSGLMVIAKTSSALSRLSRHFHRRLIEKRYLALACGQISEDAGEMNASIGRDIERRPQWRVMESGKPAVTRFTVRERFDQATLVELEPVTGRTNQLRIHCAYYGHAILGDELYGATEGADMESAGSNDKDQSGGFRPPTTVHRPPATDHRPPVTGHIPQRLCLHAWRLAFHHPAGGQWMEFVSPLPDGFSHLVDAMREKS